MFLTHAYVCSILQIHSVHACYMNTYFCMCMYVLLSVFVLCTVRTPSFKFQFFHLPTKQVVTQRYPSCNNYEWPSANGAFWLLPDRKPVWQKQRSAGHFHDGSADCLVKWLMHCLANDVQHALETSKMAQSMLLPSTTCAQLRFRACALSNKLQGHTPTSITVCSATKFSLGQPSRRNN